MVISVGRKHGIKDGDEFTVERDGVPIATLKVIRVYPDLPGATITRAEEGQQIRQGDLARPQDQETEKR